MTSTPSLETATWSVRGGCESSQRLPTAAKSLMFTHDAESAGNTTEQLRGPIAKT
jgi:hypothetical protein